MADPKSKTDVPDGLWYRQFDTENDFPEVSITKKVALCTTPRCGSHFLGHQMHAMGAFGYPLEYLNPGNWKVWNKRAGSQATLDYIKSARTGPNGVFSVKLHHEHLPAFLKQELAPLDYRFVHLCRRDLVKQAISFARAQQTGAWISDMPETAPAQYDWALIAAKVDAISRGNAAWQGFLRSVGIVPLVLYYEDIVADMPGTIEQMAAYLEIDLNDVTIEQPTFTPQRQKKASDDDWRVRFESDSRAALFEGRPIPGISPPPTAAVLRRCTAKVAKRLRAKAGL
ncbi:MAG: Stf0 family sulfotransferase [Pseudomonadota bacterium]